ncbi:hypothetical protein HPB47_004568 [Ixodes persulcatus]|uniref:Uncharacterized protein n=1 Tax=Ixodes persulcatus TaxID=34615 RepID=A0AC60PFM1_IXOPE|nr:hypothetical protein HPB47_004568 [Ixodes persulcatus]
MGTLQVQPSADTFASRGVVALTDRLQWHTDGYCSVDMLAWATTLPEAWEQLERRRSSTALPTPTEKWPRAALFSGRSVAAPSGRWGPDVGAERREEKKRSARSGSARHSTERAARLTISVDMATGQPSGDVSLVRLRLPQFWPSDPLLWFAQVEAQFSTAKITGQLQKFHQVLTVLSPDVTTEVRDLILKPPNQNPNDTPKAELVRRMSISEQRRLQQLLQRNYLAIKRHSKSMVLAPTTNITIEALAQLADRVVEVASPAVSTVATDSLAVSRSQQENSDTRKQENLWSQMLSRT